MVEKQASILIVADEPEDVAAYRRHLLGDARRRYRIQQAGAGDKALALCRRRAFDCLLLDLRLLDLNGLKTLLSLVAETGDSPCGVVLLAAAADAPRAIEALEQGAHDYLEKGLITPELLRRAVANAIEKAALLGELNQMRRETAIKDLIPRMRSNEPQDKTNERHHAETAPRGAEQLFKRLVEALPCLFWLADGEGGVTYINDRWTELTGLSSEQSAGDGWRAAIHPDDLMRVGAQWEQDVASGRPSESRHRYRTKDGEFRWHLCRSLPLRDEGGRARQWAGFGIDIHDQHEAERALREREEQFRMIFDLSGVGMLQLEPTTGRFLRANRRFRDLLGYSKPELLAMTYKDVTHPEDLERNLANFESFVRGDTREFAMEKRYVRKDGETVWALVTANMLRDDEGRPLHTVTAVQDITDRKRIEQALRQSESQLRLITDALPALISYVDAKQCYVFNNRKYEEWFGHSPDKVVGKHLRDVLGKSAYKAIRPQVEAVLSGQTVHFEQELHYNDGNKRWVNVSYIPDFGECGEVRGFVALLRDISKRRQSEEELRRATAILNAVNVSTPDLIYVKDRAGRMMMANPAFLRVLGKEGAEIIGRTDAEFRDHVGEAARIMKNDRRIMQTRETETIEEIIEMSGGPRTYLSTKSPYLNERGKVIGLIAISTDITDRKRAETARELLLMREQSAREQAENANQLKDEFLATVSHELRSPLNAMLGWIKVLKKGGIEAETQAHALDVIERSVRIQQNLIEDLIDTARIKSGKLQIEMKPVNLAGVIEAAADIVRPTAMAKEIELNLALESDEVVTGDHQRLQQVVWNLLSNAVKFTPQGGRVEAKLKRAVRSVQIVVSDTGRGIKPRDLPIIFDQFRQADGSSTRRYGGLGVGLSLVKHLIELHGGAVEADSQGEGRGSIFTINLPVRAVRGERETRRGGERERRRVGRSVSPSPPLLVPPSLSGLWMLVVDDEADARELLTVLLKQYGARVTAAASVAEALAALRQDESGKRPDVIISDISMPDEDGYMLMRRVRQLPPEEGGRIPAVALTAFERASDRVRALSAGFQFHVPKPVEPDELAMVIANLTGLADKGVNT
jgi:PAS domain S-box-containing protein